MAVATLEGTTQPPLEVEVPHERFGKYRIIRRLASGGMAHIFLASLDGPDGFSKTFVIKRILPEYASVDDFAKMFVNEAKVAALLSHPSIVQVYEFGKIDEQYFLAMEYVDGASLDRVMRRAVKANVPLGPRAAIHVGIPLAEALNYAHTIQLADGTPLSLVHRDVTPGNVLLSRSGLVKLTDFGVVKSSVNVDATVAGVVKGKYSYMSPEQAAGGKVDPRSDLFSAGVVLYELATGRRLFKRDSIAATVTAVSHGLIPRPSQFIAGFPVGFERILLKMLSRDPADRYQSARELLADLENYRAKQNWTSTGRELSGLMSALFPENGPDHTGVGPAWPGTASGQTDSALTGDAPEDPLPSIDVVEAESAAGGLEPWVLAAVIAAVGVGTGLFWYLVG